MADGLNSPPEPTSEEFTPATREQIEEALVSLFEVAELVAERNGASEPVRAALADAAASAGRPPDVSMRVFLRARRAMIVELRRLRRRDAKFTRTHVRRPAGVSARPREHRSRATGARAPPDEGDDPDPPHHLDLAAEARL